MTELLQTIGGLGIFLLGMYVMTDALQALAGRLMRSALMRFTHTPVTGAISGAAATAILQSSSATTVATVGFVGAGLLGFSESLGIIFGANIGTTITGWLVALLGFKLQLGLLMLPAIFVGILLRLFSSGRIAYFGLFLAGFGLIFVGITTMQEGMQGFQDVLTPQVFPADTFSGRLKLLVIGILITVLTQSSSAGVAAALTALYTGTIGFEQAAALVIGMDVGTTVTAAMATIGSSVNARRTGFSHVIYNLLTGTGAFFLLTPYVLLWQTFAPGELPGNAEIALVAFHTGFNLIGVIVILPFTASFARLICRLFPNEADVYTRNLDKKLIVDPELALTAVLESIHSEFLALLVYCKKLLEKQPLSDAPDLRELKSALDETRNYVDMIHLQKDRQPDWQILMAVIHSLDHLQRLHERCDEDIERALTARQAPELARYVALASKKLNAIIEDASANRWQQALNDASELASVLSADAAGIRQQITGRIASGEISVPEGTRYFEAVRWLRRVASHILRISSHQQKAQQLLTGEH
ncbi:MAG TPA: Na/Pi cotransporter family protein [Gammaproteobacteria bacterium]|nr:Na/Pi cotransporter family protein [Gammaproteobacteria bacterium]